MRDSTRKSGDPSGTKAGRAACARTMRTAIHRTNLPTLLPLASTLLLAGVAAAKLPQPVRVIESPGATRCVDVSHDGKLAAGGDSGKIFVWDAATGKRLGELAEGDRTVAALRFTNGGKTLVATGWNNVRPALDRPSDGRLTWWDLGTRKPRKRYDFPFAMEKRLVLSPDGKTIATTSGTYGDERVCLYDAATGKLLRRVPNTIGGVFVFSPDGKFLAIGGEKKGGGGRVEVSRLADDKQVMLFDPNFIPRALAISDDGKTLASSSGGELTLHRMKDGAEIARNEKWGIQLSQLIYARKGKWLLATMGAGSYVMVFDSETAKKRRTEAISYSRGGEMALSRDGKVLATVGKDEDEVRLWRVDLWE